MNSSLVTALGLAPFDTPPQIALTGSGGKTTTMFALARELVEVYPTVWLTASTHLGLDQAQQAAAHCVWEETEAAPPQPPPGGVVVFSGPGHGERWHGLSMPALHELHRLALAQNIPLLVEADGSRQRPVKAHADWEPPVPDWVDTLVVLAGLSALGQPLDERTVHRPEIFYAAARTTAGKPLGTRSLADVLLDDQVGGLKNAPPGARRIAVLNQADTPRLRFRGSQLAPRLLRRYERVIVAALGRSPAAGLQVYPRLAGIILAAGGAARIGQPKQLLPVGGIPSLLRAVRAALQAGLHPVRVVTGAYAQQVTQALAGWSVEIHHNPHWQAGQAASLRCGLDALPPDTGGVVFLPADQPFISSGLIHALRRAHAAGAGLCVAPSVGSQRTSPVLFDQALFPELRQLDGDRGGRALFSHWPPALVPWRDPRLLLDIDTLDDYESALCLQGGER